MDACRHRRRRNRKQPPHADTFGYGVTKRGGEAGRAGRWELMQSSGSLARWVGPMMAGLLLSAQLHRGSGVYALWPLLASAAFLFAAALAVSALAGRGVRAGVAEQAG